MVDMLLICFQFYKRSSSGVLNSYTDIRRLVFQFYKRSSHRPPEKKEAGRKAFNSIKDLLYSEPDLHKQFDTIHFQFYKRSSWML